MIHCTLFRPQNKTFSAWCTRTAKTKPREAQERERESWKSKVGIKKLWRAKDGWEKRETLWGEDREYCTQRSGSRRTELMYSKNRSRVRWASLERQRDMEGLAYLFLSFVYSTALKRNKLYHPSERQGRAGSSAPFLSCSPRMKDMCSHLHAPGCHTGLKTH